MGTVHTVVHMAHLVSAVVAPAVPAVVGFVPAWVVFHSSAAAAEALPIDLLEQVAYSAAAPVAAVVNPSIDSA